MKQNIKLFFQSLISNNACIDGARKKPWYAAIIIFFISIVLSVVPTTVLELKNHADKNFDSTTYGLREASYEFANYIKDTPESLFYVVKQDKKNSYLVADETIVFNRYNEQKGYVDYIFRYSTNENAASYIAQFKEANVSFVIFTPDTVYVSIMNPNSPDGNKPVVSFACTNAYKKLERNDLKTFYKEEATLTDSINSTWANFKSLIRKLYNQTRLRAAGIQLGITSAINAAVVLIMGFMVWILTRGKNNPYRLFTVWNGFAIAFWCAFTPAVLTCGLGFLIKNFASMIFPLLLGVRVMWLTMKSLRPDGSGYAAN